MTREQVVKLFPNASESFIALQLSKQPSAYTRESIATANKLMRDGWIEKAKMSATEKRYRARLLAIHASDGAKVEFQPLRLKMKNGHAYRPDFVVTYPDGSKELHECKGSFRLPSHGRSLLAFDQCRVEFPAFKFVLAKEKKKGEWEIS